MFTKNDREIFCTVEGFVVVSKDAFNFLNRSN